MLFTTIFSLTFHLQLYRAQDINNVDLSIKQTEISKIYTQRGKAQRVFSVTCTV